MPALSSTMTEGKIVEWLKQPGDKVARGESVLVVESDKADMDVESFQDGYLAAVLMPAGSTAPVGETIGLIVETEAEIADAQAKAPSAPAAAPAPASAPAPTQAAVQTPAPTPAPRPGTCCCPRPGTCCCPCSVGTGGERWSHRGQPPGQEAGLPDGCGPGHRARQRPPRPDSGGRRGASLRSAHLRAPGGGRNGPPLLPRLAQQQQQPHRLRRATALVGPARPWPSTPSRVR